MIPLDYWVMRTLRRATPQKIVDFLLDRGLYLKPGGDTSAPRRVVDAYREYLAEAGCTLMDASVCVVGYGGGFGVGLFLLEAGAGKVILQDPFAPERKARNRGLPTELLAKYFERNGDGWSPGERIELVHEHLESYAERAPGSVDIILSNSVLEHVGNLPSLVDASGRLLRESGVALHLVDLRDHYFKYPFEMLCYSESVWKRWLNASNNLNRLRVPDYRRLFSQSFEQVDLEVIDRLESEFAGARHRIRPEFLTGDDAVDSAATIRVTARGPRP